MANRNKYMGKWSPLESHCLKEAKFSFSNRQSCLGSHGGGLTRFSGDGRVERLDSLV